MSTEYFTTAQGHKITCKCQSHQLLSVECYLKAPVSKSYQIAVPSASSIILTCSISTYYGALIGTSASKPSLSLDVTKDSSGFYTTTVQFGSFPVLGNYDTLRALLTIDIDSTSPAQEVYYTPYYTLS